MDLPGTGLHVRNVISSMCAAALPPGMGMGRQGENFCHGVQALLASCNERPSQKRSPRTPLRNGVLRHGTPTSTEREPPAWLSLTEIRAPGAALPASPPHRPVSSLWGPGMSRRQTTSFHKYCRGGSDTRPTMGAMIAAASPQR